MKRPRYLALLTAVATLTGAAYLKLAGLLTAWLLLLPILGAAAILFGSTLWPAHSRRSRRGLIAGWIAYVLLIVAALAGATLASIDPQARGLLSLFLLLGTGGLMWSSLGNSRPKTYSYHNYFDN